MAERSLLDEIVGLIGEYGMAAWAHKDTNAHKVAQAILSRVAPLQHLVLLLRAVHDQHHHDEAPRLAAAIDVLIREAERTGLLAPFTQAAGQAAMDYAEALAARRGQDG